MTDVVLFDDLGSDSSDCHELDPLARPRAAVGNDLLVVCTSVLRPVQDILKPN